MLAVNTLSQEPKHPPLPSRLESQKGRVAAVLESHFVLVQFSVAGAVAHALFDRSRVVEKGRDTR